MADRVGLKLCDVILKLLPDVSVGDSCSGKGCGEGECLIR